MMIGKRLNGRYKLLKLVGGGGMANVYLAHDIILDRDVAVKILRLDFSNDEEFIKRFKREAYSITTLSHQNIVNIFDVGEEDGIYYIVMEYISGLTLKQYINQVGTIPIPKVISIMEQITAAISHAHHYEIIHRDIKPQNILITDDGTIKITDFGVALATTATAITQTNSVLGSVHYLSPEQARGGIASKQSDIYSLGIVMFELLTGRPPFSGESAVSIALKHLQTETPPPSRWNKDIPQSVENIVLKATAKDLFYRYKTADEMKIDIITALNPERMTEPKFVIPDDLEATKAIPIIKEEQIEVTNLDETIVATSPIKIQEPQPVKKQKQQAKAKTKATKKEKKPNSKSPLKILIIAALVLIIGGISAFTIIPKLFFPNDVKIPDVSELEYKEAVKILKKEGLQIGEVHEEFNDKLDENIVIRTSPSAGDVVKEDSKINIFKSIGPEKEEAPDYTGKQYESIVTIANKYFNSIETHYIESEQPKGEIVRQSPEPGSKYIVGKTKLELWISEGDYDITLPSFLGWTKSSIERYAKEQGIEVTYKEEYHDVYGEGLVFEQNPDAGEVIRKGNKITVTLSKGKKETPPKVQEYTIEIPYTATVPGTPQKVEIYVEDQNHTMDKPIESKEIKENTTFTIKLTIPYGGSAKYKVVRDDITIIEKTEGYEE
ncbi:MAG: Stk1 family PASTA domain-containing Ser/Thr kinase [Bacillaceae bacterium]